MAQTVVEGVQLPTDGLGKITAAFTIDIDGDTVYLPATVIVDSLGAEIGRDLLRSLETLSAQLARLELLAVESTEALTR